MRGTILWFGLCLYILASYTRLQNYYTVNNEIYYTKVTWLFLQATISASKYAWSNVLWSLVGMSVQTFLHGTLALKWQIFVAEATICLPHELFQPVLTNINHTIIKILHWLLLSKTVSWCYRLHKIMRPMYFKEILRSSKITNFFYCVKSNFSDGYWLAGI